VETRTGENPGDPYSPHSGAKDLQPPHDVADEVGEPIHRFRQPNESLNPVLVDPRRPGGDGQGSYEKAACSLGEGPRSRGPKLQDGQAFGRRVVRSFLDINVLHAGILDAHLFTQ